MHILYTKIPGNNDEGRYYPLLAKLPPALQEKNVRFHQWQDRWRNLLGKLLLLEVMPRYGIAPDALSTLEYTYHGRPFFRQAAGIDFNITHSGDYVACVMARGLRTGIDIEQVKPHRLEDFASTMSAAQWADIKSHAEPMRRFFTYWVIKESVIKADSRGLSLPLTGIEVTGNTAACDGRSWHLQHLQLDADYCACIACDAPIPPVVPEYKSWLEQG